MSAPAVQRNGPGGLSRRRRLGVLAICCASIVVVVMDISIVTVALPAIRADLGASVAQLQWTVDAYTLVLASLLMVSGSTADRVGRRRTFQTGLVVFGIGSLLLVPSLALLFALFKGENPAITGEYGASTSELH